MATGKILFPKAEIIDSKYFNAHQDWEVPIPGFFIIASKRKIRSISELTNEEAKEFMDILRKTRQGMKDILKIDDVYLFQNEDTEHSFHFWLFPRLPWMEKFGRKIESVRPIINHAKNSMQNEETINEVKIFVKKMNDYLNSTNTPNKCP